MIAPVAHSEPALTPSQLQKLRAPSEPEVDVAPGAEHEESPEIDTAAEMEPPPELETTAEVEQPAEDASDEADAAA